MTRCEFTRKYFEDAAVGDTFVSRSTYRITAEEGLMTKMLPTSQLPDVSPAHLLLALMFRTVQAQLVRVAAQLRIADLLKAGPQPIAALAKFTGIPASPFARVLRALADLGLVQETAPQWGAHAAGGGFALRLKLSLPSLHDLAPS